MTALLDAWVSQVRHASQPNGTQSWLVRSRCRIVKGDGADGLRDCLCVITVCYDLRFPELYQVSTILCSLCSMQLGSVAVMDSELELCNLQRLRFDEGADIMLAPSAFAVSTGAVSA